MRLIDADMLIRKYIDTDIEKFNNSDVKIVLENLKQNILKAPSIEPEQGEWTIKNGELAFWDVCSVCGKMVMHKAPFYNYCPNCGSKMKGVDRESLL